MNATSLALVILAIAAGVAFADTPKVIRGCEVKQAENGNYYNLVDPACHMSGAQDNDPSGYRLADFDGDPKTPDTFGYVDR